MPDEMYEALHRLAAESGRSMASIVREAVEAVMADDGDMLQLPSEWRSMSDGRPMINVVAAVRQSRASHLRASLRF